ncbi:MULTISPECIES: hypothetical protein [unclassified Candidatus Frackibacter]|uniref:hypothetical protein n=1 Tax=unclassified Candidatus Frackibacter TaxID=2648818 RepID=UPI000797BA6D|nr:MULTISPECIES: hypothetical protein [unclassified Candidatus Frackibacter]KXS42352.1 MAG: hypothetical protein AWU54_1351 [Candidatus Frackibacter sp. T328-2]SDC68466.1 hypothetical protein SAMN04515661_11929 [Candidatus Frackibacter sp. WG11]SEM83216.1 hypothetical protein SAMN04488698_11934 [Candidatus Frackibacter sp. WG12]SFL92067.1 hypothetical protein SAMN04488699_12029 [Candidatus Frackibacter sp. WG13]
MTGKEYNVIFAKAISVEADSEQEAKIKALSELMDQGNIGISDIIRIDKNFKCDNQDN